MINYVVPQVSGGVMEREKVYAKVIGDKIVIVVIVDPVSNTPDGWRLYYDLEWGRKRLQSITSFELDSAVEVCNTLAHFRKGFGWFGQSPTLKELYMIDEIVARMIGRGWGDVFRNCPVFERLLRD